jgi:diketogulonate reductase-like aldo/keto reductase
MKYEIAKIDDVEFYKLLERVKEDWETETRYMETLELIQDRNKWIKEIGISDDDTDEMKLITDIHTISIMVEQIRRFGGIVYDV